MRAVHGLEHEAANSAGIKRIEQVGAGSILIAQHAEIIRIRDGRELAFLVMLPVAGGHVEVQLTDVGGEHLRIADAVKLLSDEILQFTANDRTLRLPQHKALTHHLIDGEKPHLTTKATVIAFLGLFKAGEMLIELSAVREACTIDALQAGSIGIAHVVGRSHAHNLEGLAVARSPHMGTSAKISELTIAENGNLLAFGNAVKQVDLELGSHFTGATGTEFATLSHGHGLIAGHCSSLKCLVFLDNLLHLSLNLFEFGSGDVVVKFDIVVEAILNGRAGGELSLRPDTANGSSQNVRTGVAQTFKVACLVAFFQGLTFFLFRHIVLSEAIISPFYANLSSIINGNREKKFYFY